MRAPKSPYGRHADGGERIVDTIDRIGTRQVSARAERGRRIGSAARTGAAFVATLLSAAMLVGCVASDAPDPASPSDSANTEVRRSFTADPTPTPTRTVKREETREPVPFTSTAVQDPNLDVGNRVLVTAGRNGERVITYEVVYEDGREVSRSVVGDVVSVPPIQEVIAEGTRVPPPPPPPPPPAPAGGCDPNYSGPCVPISPDVDCAGGSGDGPAYVDGPVQVIGADVYDLDRDGDGIACD